MLAIWESEISTADKTKTEGRKKVEKVVPEKTVGD